MAKVAPFFQTFHYVLRYQKNSKYFFLPYLSSPRLKHIISRREKQATRGCCDFISSSAILCAEMKSILLTKNPPLFHRQKTFHKQDSDHPFFCCSASDYRKTGPVNKSSQVPASFLSFFSRSIPFG